MPYEKLQQQEEAMADTDETAIAGVAADIDALSDRIQDLGEKLDSRVRDVELEVAGRRSHEKVIVNLGYGVVAVGVLLGVFGFSEVSDIDKQIREIVERQYGEVDKKVSEIEGQVGNTLTTIDLLIDRRIAGYIRDTETTIEDFERAHKDMTSLIDSMTQAEVHWNTVVKPALEGLGDYDPDASLKGQYLLVRSSNLVVPENRARAAGLIPRIVKHLDRAQRSDEEISQFSSSDIFNVAQLSRVIDRNDLEIALVDAAFEARKDAATTALFLQAQAKFTFGEESEQALAELMGMVANLTPENPHIVLAEAWNASENLRRYTDLINALENLIARTTLDPDAFLPSYAFVIKSQSLLRRGRPGDADKAIAMLILAVERLALEGLGTQWASEVINDMMDELPKYVRFGADLGQLEAAVENSGVTELQLRYRTSVNEAVGELNMMAEASNGRGTGSAGTEMSASDVMMLLEMLSRQSDDSINP